jgi:hypothetical protein
VRNTARVYTIADDGPKRAQSLDAISRPKVHGDDLRPSDTAMLDDPTISQVNVSDRNLDGQGFLAAKVAPTRLGNERTEA